MADFDIEVGYASLRSKMNISVVFTNTTCLVKVGFHWD